MIGFKQKLDQYIENKININTLEGVLWATIIEKPKKIEEFNSELKALVKQKALSNDADVRLCSVVNDISKQTLPKLLRKFRNNGIGYKALERGLIADLSFQQGKPEYFSSAFDYLSHERMIPKQVSDDLVAVIDEYFNQSPSPLQQRSVPTFLNDHQEFSDLLGYFLSHRISFEKLTEGLGEVIRFSEQNKAHCRDLLQVFYENGVLKKEEFQSLCQTINPMESFEYPLETVSSAEFEFPLEMASSAEFESPLKTVGSTEFNIDEFNFEDLESSGMPERQESSGDTTIRIKAKTKSLATSTIIPVSTTWMRDFEQESSEKKIMVGSILKDRFKITAFIGHGGMGDVFKAEDLRRVDANDVESEVAIKVLNKEFREHRDSLTSLQREARKTQNLAHPHIVNVFDFDRDEHNVFMVMELMDGDTLNTVIKKNPHGLPLELVFKYVQEIASALQYAHRRGVVHCDFKPGNICLSGDEIKIFDFGIARAAKSGMSEVSKRDSFDAGDIGALTPAYASPEMLNDSDDPEAQDDIYALGCIVYELLSGLHPFVIDGKKVPSNEAKKLGMKAKRIKELTSWQWNALKGCLEFHREDRIATVSSFADEFLIVTKPISKKIKYGLIAASLVLGYVGWDFKQYYDVNEFIELVKSEQDIKILARTNEIMTFEQEKQLRYFGKEGALRELKEYFAKRVQALTQSDDYEEALLVINLANKVYGDSAAIYQIKQSFEETRNKRIAQLDGELSNILSDSLLFFSKRVDFKIAWDTLKKVDKNNGRFTNILPVLLLEELIQNELKSGNYAVADELIRFSLGLFGDDKIFASFIVQIKRIQESIKGNSDQDKTGSIGQDKTGNIAQDKTGNAQGLTEAFKRLAADQALTVGNLKTFFGEWKKSNTAAKRQLLDFAEFEGLYERLQKEATDMKQGLKDRTSTEERWIKKVARKFVDLKRAKG
ncbi:MAG: serine/threonine protein kinase [Phenylobacterium sp.]|jgi:serine/threonine protein kinase